MAVLLIVLGLVIMFLVHFTIGLILLIVGLVLLFVPAVPGGYNSWHGPR